MSRDIADRLELFTRGHFTAVNFRRVALNRNQVDQYSPPPNPAKSTDSRYGDYSDSHGEESWELDALDPRVITELVREAVLAVRDEPRWATALKAEAGMKADLNQAAAKWPQVAAFLKGGDQ